MTALDSATFPDWLNVSRETSETFGHFVELVAKWNPAINLVSKRSLADIWNRHVYDSAQLFCLIPATARHLVDLGSGGGFPGIILAIMAREAMPEMRVTLVEADQRKATFLSEAVRRLALPSTVAASRIESLAPQAADVITARALASLVTLCGLVHRHIDPGGVALIAKGALAESEVDEARPVWSFSVKRHASKSDEGATILAITDLRHV